MTANAFGRSLQKFEMQSEGAGESPVGSIELSRVNDDEILKIVLHFRFLFAPAQVWAQTYRINNCGDPRRLDSKSELATKFDRLFSKDNN